MRRLAFSCMGWWKACAWRVRLAGGAAAAGPGRYRLPVCCGARDARRREQCTCKKEPAGEGTSADTRATKPPAAPLPPSAAGVAGLPIVACRLLLRLLLRLFHSCSSTAPAAAVATGWQQAALRATGPGGAALAMLGLGCGASGANASLAPYRRRPAFRASGRNAGWVFSSTCPRLGRGAAHSEGKSEGCGPQPCAAAAPVACLLQPHGACVGRLWAGCPKPWAAAGTDSACTARPLADPALWPGFVAEPVGRSAGKGELPAPLPTGLAICCRQAAVAEAPLLRHPAPSFWAAALNLTPLPGARGCAAEQLGGGARHPAAV